MADASAMADAEQRERAVDPERSFIVQAPAGSGKTELLIQRYLALLARVHAPEEIVAVTFTRKAAGEMRDRVLQALALASGDSAPDGPHRRRTRELARAVRLRDTQLAWGLAESPVRLRIQTIDSLCAGFTRQMPVLSGFGAQPEIVEDPAGLFAEAARRTLAQLDQGGEWSAVVGRVLIHLDNNVELAEPLLASMLARRDQWLRYVADPDSRRIHRETLEAALARSIVDALETLRQACPASIEAEVCALARHAASNLVQSGRPSAIQTLHGLSCLPGATVDDLAVWRAIAELFLIDGGTLRKRITAEQGFPPPGSAGDKGRQAQLQAHRERLDAVLVDLARHQTFVDALHLTRSLPPPRYTDAQWEVVEALTQLLPLAVAQLDVLFRERGQVDFTAVSQAAVQALGSDEEPTDLALALDYRIRHLLVDEFQDTSQSQYELLTRLTAGWQPGDGRTLFLVGDPMQSIYRFRQAEVGLYLRARREGIGTVELEPLTLSVNFRSQAQLVAWVNESFRILLPDAEDLGSGAVLFSASTPTQPALSGPAASVHPVLGKDQKQEARIVASLVRSAQSEDPERRTAILVRSRGHLAEIVPVLKDAGLRFQAIEIEALGHRPVVQDLHSLTRALLHPADRIAWLAVLRAPWCGLTLADLAGLTADAPVVGGSDIAIAPRERTLWELMDDVSVLDRLSTDGRERLERLRDRLRPCFAQRRREPLRRWVEGAWLALGGPASAEDATDLEDAAIFLGLLDELEEGGDLPDFGMLDERVARLYALPAPDAGDRLQIMTIHKAKGLEFDTVILPGLGYAPRPNDSQLLLWLERPRAQRGTDLLLAPIRERSEDTDPIYRYLALLDGKRAEHEDERLLYVAATRAKARLHLVGHCEVKDQRAQPRKRSLLDRLWPVVGGEFERALANRTTPDAAEPEARVTPATTILRVPTAWSPPAPRPSSIETSAWRETGSVLEAVEFSWASETAKHIGSVVHRWLQTIAEEGIGHWPVTRLTAFRAVLAHDLRVLGVPETELARALARVIDALTSALEDQRARWVLSKHAEAQSELRLTGVIDAQVVNIIVDRTFIDELGVRWIIDYKTGLHEGADLDGFLDNERERYRDQLERYATLLARLDSRPIRLALYFPLLKGWREWEIEKQSRLI